MTPGLLALARSALAGKQIDKAIDLFSQAERQGADADQCASGRWNCYMLLGDFGSAWRESDSIEARGLPDPNRFWDGSSLTGKHVILRCLHGLGDTLQFLRFAPRIKAIARSLSIEVQPALKTLIDIANRDGYLADRILTWNDVPPGWDSQIEVNELPRILRVDNASVVSSSPYLRLPPVPSAQRNGKRRLQVGLVWAGGDFNPARSIPPELLAPLFQIDDVDWHSLQAGEQHCEVERYGWPMAKVCTSSTPIVEVASAMLNLDFIVTVDTMTAHLAGSLGRPVWTMLPFVSDWRWLLNRADSPWYPSMRLFRQPKIDGWEMVIAEVCSELQVRKHLVDA